MMKIVILDGYTLNPGDLSWEGLEKLGDDLTVYDRTPEEKILERIDAAEIVYTNKTPLTGETLARAPQLKFIGVLATGYNVVDVAAAKAKGIPVTNVPTYGTAAVAQMAIALLLEICHHAGAHSEAVKKGYWTKNPDFCFWNYPLIELDGKTMGIIGYGKIGQATGKIAQALGMKVLAYDQYQEKSLESATMRYVGLEDLLAESDVISLHCPLFENNRGMINRAAIARMKDGVIIINTSRGPLIAEDDLAEALNSGKVAGAAVDVVSAEPIAPDNPLLMTRNCIITPHIAWAPKEARQRLLNVAIKNLQAFLAGKPVNVVNR
jgi:glycerate dehydrogenase